MYTRKQQMEKVKHLERKVDAISANMEAKVNDFLVENLAQVVQFNHAMTETLQEILTDKQHADFIELMATKMTEVKVGDL